MSEVDNEEPRRKSGMFSFPGEVQAEGRKVTWATRQEVTVSTIMVLIMGAAAAVFFFIVDMIMRTLMSWILQI